MEVAACLVLLAALAALTSAADEAENWEAQVLKVAGSKSVVKTGEFRPPQVPHSVTTSKKERPLCNAPTTAPRKLEKVINQCQEEIKYALLQEALSVLGETIDLKAALTRNRSKRETFTGEERRIAGCLLQCVYRKMKALDETGFPTATGLVKIYSEGVEDRNYYLATIQGVQQCLARELQNKTKNPSITKAEGYSCDVAYDMFNCVSEQIEQLCGTSP